MSTSRTREKADGELFKSTGIDDNATSTAITIDASEDIEAGTYSSSGATNGIKFNLSSNTGRINISSINSTSDMLNFNTTNGEVGSIQAVGSGTIYSTGGTGGGIKLGGTGAANTLDDYEEGTWTPIDSSGAGLTLSVSGANYVKVGTLVHVSAYFNFPNNGNGLGARIGGLPFTAKNNQNYSYLMGRSTIGGIMLQVDNNSTTSDMRPADSDKLLILTFYLAAHT
jgi:hypothetical protein